MTIYRRVGGVNKEIVQQYRGVGGVNKEITKQYRGVGGVNKQVFQKWNGEIYDAGNEYTAQTGGIICSLNEGGTFTKNASDIRLFTGSGIHVVACTANKIDFTKWNTLNFSFINGGGTSAYQSIGYGDALDGAFIASTTSSMNMSAGTRSFDISSITGMHYAKVLAYNKAYFNITKIWLS